ncbi:OsmC family protein [Frankia symbiont of Datisca glomerata] [Mycobacterium shimoidei]|uniref:OsmC family protein [Frankia symbiont of Datisca glomerata] n=1 Tax=Mycobacterium shimoidei TaxID=29313 RepID=A0A375Z3Q5_MYCSH|nr:OsmC family protein [Mycobacterium shimoidei]SRX95769.1 OsmC family protein [Frankia symbiont of Datisca glomerata] [Mycobacterium shimoidei]
METAHTYRTRCQWSGSTGGGYRNYSREHAATADPAQDSLVLSADPAFLGQPDHLNPEQLLVMAASSCQLLSFLAVAARARVDVLAYADDAEGVMPRDNPVRLSRITLRPRIIVAAGSTVDQIRRLVEAAHRDCYIANSLRTEVEVVPQIEIATEASG